jgi:hypothetical protein
MDRDRASAVDGMLKQTAVAITAILSVFVILLYLGGLSGSANAQTGGYCGKAAGAKFRSALVEISRDC